MGRVLHTGQAIVDLVMRVPAMPPVGGDVYAHRFELTAGGGFNVMAAAARDDADVVYLGTVGTGPFGDKVRAALRAEHIAAPNPPVAGLDTGVSVAIVDAGAERTFVSALGAEGQVTPGHLNAVPVRPDDVVYVTGYSLRHPVNGASLTGWLATIDPQTAVVFDPAPLLTEIPEAAWAAVTARATIWTLNAREAGIALGRLTRTVPEHTAPAELAEALAGLLPAAVLVRDGGGGTYVADRAGVRHVPAHAVTPVDTNGAGDAHTGVLAACLARGADLLDAARRANVAAAIAVTRQGPATAPTTEEIDTAITRHGSDYR
ncbi:PfkB family carbohydrate kinase [Streptomyces sp. NPDC047000]|uniref:PfkB family carbohydrate kinase n=1 Tax=Streptomyces sp. NPDC047000 TaxID=3155474 RepID=UPI0033C4132D